MAQEDYDFAYKDISELKNELEGIKAKKEISPKELSETVQKLTHTLTEMLEVFGAAAEQMKLEEKEYEINTKKHDQIILKLDKLIDQNRTIAEGMVAIVEMVKEKIVESREIRREDPKPIAPPWQPRADPMRRQAPMPTQMQSPIPGPSPNPIPGTMMTGSQIPPQRQAMPPISAPGLGSSPDFPELDDIPSPPSSSDLDFDFNMDEEPKKKGMFGMFKK